jgi:hypothetical protein
MSDLIDELHGLAEDLEDEGHSLAGRFRDLVERAKADFGHLLGGGKNDLEAFVTQFVGTLAPELDKLKAQIVAEVVVELRKALADVAQLAATATPADTAAPAAQEQVEPAPAPAQG